MAHYRNGKLIDLTAEEEAAFEAERASRRPVPPTLDAIKARLKVQIDNAADRYAPRAALRYQEKFAQAEAIDALGEPAASALSEAEMTAQFPIVAADVGLDAATLWEAAQSVITAYQKWAQLSYQVERARRGGKLAIDAAQTEAAARSAYEAVSWP